MKIVVQSSFLSKLWKISIHDQLVSKKKSADVVLKTITVLKEMRIVQLPILKMNGLLQDLLECSSLIGNAGGQMKAIQPTKIFHLTVGLAMSNQREKDKYWKGTEQRSLFSLHTFDIRWCWKRDSHSTSRHKPMFQIY